MVATSELLAALWPDEDRPATARKIVQNAVWGLRAVLAGEPPADAPQDTREAREAPGRAPELVTQAPGYVLRVDPTQVDLHRFNRRVAEGRTRLSAGEPQEAARLLGLALGEWRGPALADLAEAGTDWPELTALRQLRLDVMEDRFEAELRSGQHHAVLGELVSLTDAEPLRERLCGQLMLALYRCGRQAEALNVFSRVRRALVEEHGLEPSRELHVLQQHILTHDPSLTPGAEPARAAVTALPAPTAASIASAAAPVAERRAVAVLLVRSGPGQPARTPALSLHDSLAAVADCVEEYGGTVAGSLGHVSVAVFGLRADPATASVDAVRAALALRTRLDAPSGSAAQAVVVSGDALVRHDPRDPTAPVSVAGRLVDEASALLPGVAPGEIHLGGGAVRDTEGLVRQLPADRPGVRRVVGLQPTGGGGAAPLHEPPGGHSAELAILGRLLERARRHDAPHLVTILGDPGVGKSRFLDDFQHTVSGEPVRVVRVGSEDGARWTARDVLMACCGLSASAAVGDRLTEIVRRLAGHGETAERLLRCLRPVLGGGDAGLMRSREILDSWCELLALLAREQPLVLCLDDAHRAEDSVLDCVERLASTTQEVPLFVVACARPELLELRPFWGSGLRHSTTLTLDRTPDPAPDPVAGPPWARHATGRRQLFGGA